MCEDVSVNCWLKSLRHNFEYYEAFDNRIFGSNDVRVMETPRESINPEVEIRKSTTDTEVVAAQKPSLLQVKFAELNRVSAVFVDPHKELQVLPAAVLVHLEFDIAEDAISWKDRLRSDLSCCEEEQNIMEIKVYIMTFAQSLF
ncbi:hypothetical protein JTB14_036004 [Gonioctena quinquepunctata]|nr:hypothetical protein JTB14_036004 [Gonioctena quinquepunctata]